MTRHELELLDSEDDDACYGGRSRQRRQRPRSHNVSFARQRRTPQIPLGIKARGGRRSTYRSLTRGNLRTMPGLSCAEVRGSVPGNETL